MVVTLTDTVGGLPFSGTDYNNNLAAIEAAFVNVSDLTAANTFSGQPNTFSAAPTATTQRGATNFGAGGFAGSAGHFVGHASGTLLAGNAASGFAGDLIHLQLNGATRMKLDAAGVMTVSSGVDVGGTFGSKGTTAAPSLITNEEAGTNSITFPLMLRHVNTTGTGATGIGVGFQMEVESNTEGSTHSIGSVSCYAVANNLGTQTGALRLRVAKVGSNVTVVDVQPSRVLLEEAAIASANHAQLNVGSGGWGGGAGHFAGSANGTLIATNAPSGFTGDLLNLQTNGVSRLRITGAGATGFNAATPIAKPTITGSRAGNAALASLLTELANYGLITDSTSA